jgi:hypothetical protein
MAFSAPLSVRFDAKYTAAAAPVNDIEQW